MNRQAQFINEYQRMTGAPYNAARMVWVRANLSGEREFVNMVLDHAERRKARLLRKQVVA